MPLDEDVDFASGQRVIVRVDPQSKLSTPWTTPFREVIGPYRRDLDADPANDTKA